MARSCPQSDWHFTVLVWFRRLIVLRLSRGKQSIIHRADIRHIYDCRPMHINMGVELCAAGKTCKANKAQIITTLPSPINASVEPQHQAIFAAFDADPAIKAVVLTPIHMKKLQ